MCWNSIPCRATRHPIFEFKKLRQMAFKMTPLGERGVEAG
jgi:hypothetical protein